MQKSKIAILLATYNGENYLVQQIESIINQTNSDWTLYIRDDGSTDSTLDLISSYIDKYANIILLQNSANNIGAMKSFIWLMENVESDYYMFCDQDDVWLPKKIEISYFELQKLENRNKELALLIFTDLCVVDQSLNIISSSMWDYTRYNRIMEPNKYLLVGTLATGCTMFFNNKAKMAALKYADKAIMHDSLIALSVVHSGGLVKEIPISLIYYRQHGKNVLGVEKFDNSIKSKIFNLKHIILSNYEYFKFVKSITNLSLFKFLILKIEMLYRVRYISK
jgi:glycosyltransferase involved in cell wall biosynthesis